MTKCHEPAPLPFEKKDAIKIHKKRGTNNETVYQCGY